MKKCSNPEHPHCTVWVMPGDEACAHGHPQPAPAPQQAPASAPGVDMLSALRARRRAGDRAIRPQPAPAPQSTRPHLHISGFDPRAAGGRQAIKLALRGVPSDLAPELTMLVQSDLSLHGGERHAFTRTLGGDWLPVFIEFSSRGLEHGQHRIDVELHSRGEALTRTWVCTLVILVPRQDASLTDIHQAFLSTHKNVRVVADDASIARVNARTAGPIDIDVSARDASIAQLDLEAPPGRQDLGFSTIAWDEDLIEIDVPAAAEAHPCPASAACLVDAAPHAGAPRHLRVFALDEFVLGRFEAVEPEADVLLAHFGAHGEDRGGLTRRLSGRHAVIRRGRDGFEIEDVSRYGLLLDGAWPGQHVAAPLRLGMRIELTASIREVVVLEVTALLPHGVILHRADGGAGAECFCLLEPERHPATRLPEHCAMPQAAALPLLFHRDGGFWHLDPATGKETALAPATALDRLDRFSPDARFAAGPYPETWIARVRAGDRRRVNAATGASASAGGQRLGA
jgi:hypothetical protein